MKLEPYLRLMADKGASDIFFSVGARPEIKVEGRSLPVGKEPLDGEALRAIASTVIGEDEWSEFERSLEMNTSYAAPGIGRFRAYVYRQRGAIAVVLRAIKQVIPSIEELALPPVLERLTMEKRGLILVVGATGSGKSTTLAAMVDHRNANATGHILTVEDPIEFVYTHKRSVVDQREVGIDTLSYEAALRNALRSAPDLITIGEVRDADTMQHALRFAETGHLCMATLHATNAAQAIERAVNFFPEDAKHRVLQDLALNLRAVIAQRLVPSVEGTRVAAVEVMVRTALIASLIGKGEITELRTAMEKGGELGTRTFDAAVFDLWKNGRIEPLEALRYADSSHEVRMRIEFERPGTFSDIDPAELEIQL